MPMSSLDGAKENTCILQDLPSATNETGFQGLSELD
jgi:hypothetical protein